MNLSSKLLIWAAVDFLSSNLPCFLMLVIQRKAKKKHRQLLVYLAWYHTDLNSHRYVCYSTRYTDNCWLFSLLVF